MRWLMVLGPVLAMLLLPAQSLAHGGGLDRHGCHNDRKSGGYHCHRSYPPPVTPARSQPAPTPAPTPAPVPAPPRAEVPPSPPAVMPEAGGDRAVVAVANLRLRAGQSSRSTVLARLSEGARVKVIDSRGSWWRVDPDGPVGPGYVAARYLKSDLRTPQPEALSVNSRPAKSDEQIAQDLIAESISRYSGSCPCPYNTDRAGRRCGARSAYSKPGGRAPMCFVSDVPVAMIRSRR